MATESPLLHDGSQTISGTDTRNSTITGTTLGGPNGSGQFLAVALSTATARTVNPTTALGQRIYGILQNKPSTGLAADVGVFGISKVVCASSTTVGIGQMIMASTSGTLLPYSSAASQYPCGVALESAAASQVFSAAIYGFGAGCPGLT